MESESPTSGQPASGLGPGLSSVPLFHAAWLFALGIAVAHWLWLRPSLMLVALVPVAVLCVVAALRAQRITWLPLAVLWCMLGAWCALMEPHPAPAPALASLSDGLLRSVEGTVVDAGPVRGEIEQNLNDDQPAAATPTPQPSQRIDLRVSSLETVTDAEDTQTPISGGVRLTVRWPESAATQPTALTFTQSFHCGERVRAVVRLLPPETYHDPGVWSRQDFLLDQGITSTATVDIERVDRLGSSTGAFLACRLSGLQHATTTRLLALPATMRRLPAPLRLTPDDAIMLAAMVAGDRTYLTHSLRVGFERTGSFHMLVVSGFHLAIVAACVFWIARRLRLPRVPATLLTIIVSFAYALFTGFATPVQRSLWMVTLYLLGRLLYRERSPLNTIGFAALCLLAVSPRSLFDSSLQMTLLAVIAIAGVAAPLLRGAIHPYLTAMRDLRLTAVDAKLAPHLAQFRVLLRMVAARIKAAGHNHLAWRIFPSTVKFLLWSAELVVISCVVELAMALPMAVYFHRITIFALPVNIFILPLLVCAHAGRAVHAAGARRLAPGRRASGHVCGAGAAPRRWPRASFRLAGLGRFPHSQPAPVAIRCLLRAACRGHRAGASGRFQRPALASPPCLGRPVSRRAGCRGCRVPLNTLAMRCSLKPSTWARATRCCSSLPTAKPCWWMAAALAADPHQAPQDYDIGEEVVSPTLWARGIRHLDAVALSHAHSDHMGGLPAILRNFHPDELWVGNNPRVAAYNALLDQAAALHVRVRTFHSGDAFPFGRTQVAVLAPFPNYQPGPEPANNDSLVLHVAYGATSVMLEGDAEAPIEDAMLARPAFRARCSKWAITAALPPRARSFWHAWLRSGPSSPAACATATAIPASKSSKSCKPPTSAPSRTDIDGASCFLLDGKSGAADLQCGWRQIP